MATLDRSKKHKGVTAFLVDPRTDGISIGEFPMRTLKRDNLAEVHFDNVFVPWERVFLLGDPDRCNNMSQATHQYLHSGHQVVTKNVVKCEFILGLANLMSQTLGSGQQPQVMQMTAEIIESLETTKALLRAAEADAEFDQWGVMCPADMPIMVARGARGSLREIWPRIKNFQ